jgi:F-type H+-transporting ATPase subunit gamma
MSGTTESMRQRIDRTEAFGTVVHTMKALAASRIGQYEESVRALDQYYRTIRLGLTVCLRGQAPRAFTLARPRPKSFTGAIVFGSDQGLVGAFNEALLEFALRRLAELPGEKRIWVVGERVHARLQEAGLTVEQRYAVPNTVDGITPLIGRLLAETTDGSLYIFYNRPRSEAAYEPALLRMLPLDEHWLQDITGSEWPTAQLPEVLGDREPTLGSLIREYLFVTLFKACAESLTAENASRLAAMQQAEKNIAEMLEELKRTYHRVRQSTIDEELFDIVAGFEALKQDRTENP